MARVLRKAQTAAAHAHSAAVASVALYREMAVSAFTLIPRRK